ncbi:olfactory receptor 51E1-like [Discoglossus pictus]
MLTFNTSSNSSTTTSSCTSSSFILSGIPGLEESQFWLGLPLVSMYIVAVIGNSTMLYIIKTEQDLHEPMYIFLFMLSAVDLLLATTTMPKMLGIFWFNSIEIGFDTCLVQMFFIHFLSALESGILVAMAVDRYVAICHPLRYTSILTNETITKTSLIIAIRGAVVMIPIPLLIKRLSFGHNNLLTHSYCLHQEVMKRSCVDYKVNIVYGLFVILSVMGIDSLFISLSYLLILKTVVGLVEEASLKAFSTCAAHICAVLVYYIPLIGLSVVHRFGTHQTPNLHILFGNVYLLVPPVINPIIYGIKTQKIRQRLSKIFGSKRKRKQNSSHL